MPRFESPPTEINWNKTAARLEHIQKKLTMTEAKILFLIVFFGISHSSISQTKSDTTIFLHVPTATIKLYEQKSKSDYDYVYVSSTNYFYVYGNSPDLTKNSNRTIKVVFEGKHYDAIATEFKFTKEETAIMNKWTDEWENQRGFIAERRQVELENLKKAIEKEHYLKSILTVDSSLKAGLIFMWSWSESGYSLKSQDFNFEIVNGSKKKIKYIWITASIFNPVGDFIGKKTMTAIGPIEYLQKSTYSFENVFFSNVAEEARINQVKIQYFDGTIKTFTGTLLKRILTNKEYYERYLNYLENGEVKLED